MPIAPHPMLLGALNQSPYAQMMGAPGGGRTMGRRPPPPWVPNAGPQMASQPAQRGPLSLGAGWPGATSTTTGLPLPQQGQQGGGINPISAAKGGFDLYKFGKGEGWWGGAPKPGTEAATQLNRSSMLGTGVRDFGGSTSWAGAGPSPEFGRLAQFGQNAGLDAGIGQFPEGLGMLSDTAGTAVNPSGLNLLGGGPGFLEGGAGLDALAGAGSHLMGPGLSAGVDVAGLTGAGSILGAELGAGATLGAAGAPLAAAGAAELGMAGLPAAPLAIGAMAASQLIGK